MEKPRDTWLDDNSPIKAMQFYNIVYYHRYYQLPLVKFWHPRNKKSYLILYKYTWPCSFYIVFYVLFYFYFLFTFLFLIQVDKLILATIIVLDVITRIIGEPKCEPGYKLYPHETETLYKCCKLTECVEGKHYTKISRVISIHTIIILCQFHLNGLKWNFINLFLGNLRKILVICWWFVSVSDSSKGSTSTNVLNKLFETNAKVRN